MSQSSTDRELLKKGVIRLALCLPFMALGPILIFTGAGSDHPVVFLFPGIVFAGLAIVFMFQGINLILDSMFKSKHKR